MFCCVCVICYLPLHAVCRCPRGRRWGFCVAVFRSRIECSILVGRPYLLLPYSPNKGKVKDGQNKGKVKDGQNKGKKKSILSPPLKRKQKRVTLVAALARRPPLIAQVTPCRLLRELHSSTNTAHAGAPQEIQHRLRGLLLS